MRDPFGGGGGDGGGMGKEGVQSLCWLVKHIIIISNSDKGRTLDTSTLRLLTVAELCYQLS